MDYFWNNYLCWQYWCMVDGAFSHTCKHCLSNIKSWVCYQRHRGLLSLGRKLNSNKDCWYYCDPCWCIYGSEKLIYTADSKINMPNYKIGNSENHEGNIKKRNNVGYIYMKKNKSKVTSAPVEVVKEDKVSTDLEKNCEKLINLFNKSNIYLHFNDSERKVLLDKYIIYYTSKTAAVQTLEEVFVNMPYYFQIAEANPFIVDAGSEVGIATIFFKIFYPKSKILCFEAHPNAFSLLKKNIKVNKLSNIMAINAALTTNEGTIEFFGEFNAT